MLSYRHAYHAGNFADVMKHVALTAMLRYMTQKDAALCYVDTHAGAGGYDLRAGEALKTGESQLGIGKLFDASDAPAAVDDYLGLVRKFNPAGTLANYPGSPWFAAQLLRAQDRLVLCELHGTDHALLERRFAGDARVHCHAEDGNRFTRGLLPPLERRGLVFMDPAYELRDDYRRAVATLGQLHRRFAGGSYALWYPLLDEHRTQELRRDFEALKIRDILHLALRVADNKTFPGMYGSGMIVINPPWTLRATMQASLPWLVAELGVNDKAACQVEQWVDE